MSLGRASPGPSLRYTTTSFEFRWLEKSLIFSVRLFHLSFPCAFSVWGLACWDLFPFLCSLLFFAPFFCSSSPPVFRFVFSDLLFHSSSQLVCNTRHFLRGVFFPKQIFKIGIEGPELDSKARAGVRIPFHLTSPKTLDRTPTTCQISVFKQCEVDDD